MSILSGTDIYKSYGVTPILEDVNFYIEKGDKIGVLGGNGAGKTTLLKLIAGDLLLDRGEISSGRDIKIGYLRQTDDFEPEDTVLQVAEGVFKDLMKQEEELVDIADKLAVMEHDSQEYISLLNSYERKQEVFQRDGGYTYKSRAVGILSGMAFAEKDWNKQVKLLSGGERTRLALSCILLKEPDLLLLDEPTNHLDIGTIRWLEQYIKAYKGTVVLVSHDRYFLDKTINKIFYIENHRLTTYKGDYSFCAEQRRINREIEQKHFENVQKKIQKEETLIRKFKERGTEKLAKRAASREKRLESMEKPDVPTKKRGSLKLSFKEAFVSGRDVLKLEGVSKSFRANLGTKTLFENVNMDIKRGDKVCILGANGIGKTTLLKIITGRLTPDKGYIKIGHNIKIGYYDQRQEMLSSENNLIEELQDEYCLYSAGELRNILGGFLFRGEQVFMPVSSLSGGEKARLSLLKVIMSGANLLIMDEPTNHLDLESKEVFEEAMLAFPGTAIIVSHDRYFLSKVPDKIMELSKDGFTLYHGGYDYYTEKSKDINSGKKYLDVLADREPKMENKNQSDARALRAKKKEEEAVIRRRERERAALENEIERLEEEQQNIETEMCDEAVISDIDKLMVLSEKLDEIKELLQKNYEKWLQY